MDNEQKTRKEREVICNEYDNNGTFRIKVKAITYCQFYGDRFCKKICTYAIKFLEDEKRREGNLERTTSEKA